MINLSDLYLHCPECGAFCKPDLKTDVRKIIFRCTKCGNNEEMIKPVVSKKI